MELLLCNTWGLCSFFVALTLLGLHFYLNYRSRRVPQGLPPGSFGWPVIGETLELKRVQKINKSWLFVEDRVQRYGPVFKTSLLLNPMVVLASPAGNKFIFSNENKLVQNFWPTSLSVLLGENTISTLSKQKRIFMSFLKPEGLRKQTPRVCDTVVDHLKKHWDGKDIVEAELCMKTLAFSLASKLLFSLDSKEEQLVLSELFQPFRAGLLQLPLNFPGTKFYKGVKAREKILKLLDKIIKRRKEELQEGSIPRDEDLLSVLLTTVDNEGKYTPEADIKDLVLTMLYGGYDTTTITLTMLLKFLADYPAWKDKLLEEHLKLHLEKMQATGGSAYVLQWEDLQAMKWTWRCLQETLRLQPQAEGADRKALKDFEFDGFQIPQGSTLHWSVHSTHRNDKYFPDPHKFDPTRFDGLGPAPFTWVPFGGGSRLCPGYEFAKMEMLVFFHYFVQKYDWDLVDKNEKIIVDPFPRTMKGLPVYVRLRN